MILYRKILVLLFVCVSSFTKAQSIPMIKFTDLQNIFNKKTDTLYVVNFWATWCKPCVDEMPYFLQMEKKLKNEKVKFVFISLNFKRELETKVVPFLKQRKITSTVLLLDEPDYNSWIDRVDKSWQGSIPATVIFNNSIKKFFEKEFTFDELEKEIKKLLN